MAEPTIQLGGGNWAGKTDNLLGYYKEGERFYKQDFTFSRSTTGTYTDSDGYIQEMPYNLASYSEDYTNSLQGASTTFGTITSPTSKLNASTITTIANGTYKGWNKSYSLIGSTDYTFSFYVKYKNKQWLSFYHIGSAITKFDVQNGIFGSNSIGMTKEDVGDGWYRLSGTITASSGTNYFYVYNSGQNDQNSSIGDAFYLFGIQLVKGTSAKTYFPTTTRLNMPRVDYKDNSNGSLILEPQRTNAINYSNDYTLWSNTQFTINGNSVTSPEGITSGTKIVPSTSNTEKYLDKGGFVRTSGQYITHTVYAKASGYNFLYLSNSASRLYAVYDLQQGLVIYNNSNGSDFNNHSASIELFGNGWYKCELIGQAQSSFASYFRISCGITAINSSTQGLFQGDGTSGIEVYGSQVELNASYATSYIPTQGSSVTRNADACELTNVADRINSSEGTIYGEQKSLETNFSYNYFASVSDGTNNNRLEIRQSSTGLQFLWRVGGTYQSEITKSNAPFTSFIKYALRYSSTDIKFYVNGSLVGTINSPTLYASGVLNNIEFADGIGGNNFRGTVKELKYYNTALTDSELVTLTT
jgi:hypothetical protein